VRERAVSILDGIGENVGSTAHDAGMRIAIRTIRIQCQGAKSAYNRHTHGARIDAARCAPSSDANNCYTAISAGYICKA
jgi:NADPH-dependent curcumin reductase CurA